MWAEKEAGKFVKSKDAVKSSVARAYIAASEAYRTAIGEIPLPTQVQELSISPLPKETQQLIEHLKKDGMVIYDLSGKTPVALHGEGMRFSYVNPVLENFSSKPSLVAFNPHPDKFFLQGSLKLPHVQQLELLDQEKILVEKAYSGAGLLVREWYAPELIEATHSHFKATDQKLFGPDHNFNWTWTNTYASEQAGADRAYVGDWGDVGLVVSFVNPDFVYPSLGLAPVVEIPRI